MENKPRTLPVAAHSQRKRRLALALLVCALLALPTFAEEVTFPQKIEWKSNANALEYKVELQNTTSGRTQTITTDKTSTELSLVPGKYRYRVYAYDFLGREASVSAWTSFEVFKASTPRIRNVEKDVTIGKADNSVEISVSISDINANSKFELVNESLEGTIDASERAQMKSGSSETESITKLGFKGVPPGQWRLRVTNASGLTSTSDVITVHGERTYTEEEVALIKKEAEDAKEAALKKDFQNNLDEYIRLAEEEKAREAERIAREKEEAEKARLAEEARLKAEREAAEQARLEAERKLEEERIAAENARREEERQAAERERQMQLAKAAAEKKEREEARRLARLERKNRPYKWKDIVFEGGVGYTATLYDSTIKDYYDDDTALALNFRIKFLPVKTASNKFGLELNMLYQKFEKETDFYSAELISAIFDVKFVWQHNLTGNLFLCAKGGGGTDIIQKKIDYGSASSRGSAENIQYMYPAAVGGLSLFLIPWKCIVLEAGIDFAHVLGDSSRFGFITPYACVGFRF